MEPQIKVHIVNQDKITNSLIKQILGTVKIEASDYSSPEELFSALPIESPACFLIDMILPQMSGVQLLSQLHQLKSYQPCIFMSNKIVPEMLIEALDVHPFSFIKRPFVPEKLLSLVQQAIIHDREQSLHINGCKQYLEAIESLSLREQEVFHLLTRQMTSKTIAKFLYISQRTVENHRRKILQKLKVKSTTDLIYYQAKLEVLSSFSINLA